MTSLESPSRLWKRDITTEAAVVDDMVFISQPEGLSLNDMDHNYMYDSTAGAGQVAYLLDFGVNTDNPVRQMP